MSAAVALALPLAPLGAQANPDSVELRNDCRLAVQTIRTGEPGPKVQWAWDLIPACPESGAASAAALRRLRHDPDTAHFAPVQVVGFNVRDGELFAAALEVAGDRGATNVAREASFIILVYQLMVDRDVAFAELSQADLTSGCPLGSVDDRGVPVTLTPLPADAAVRAGALASVVAENAQEPAVVRIAADCITQGIRQHSLRQP